MKQQYAVIHDGKHVMNTVAGSVMGAIGAAQRKAAKHGLPPVDPAYAIALPVIETDNIGRAIELACLETIRFEPA